MVWNPPTPGTQALFEAAGLRLTRSIDCSIDTDTRFSVLEAGAAD